jgi:anti-anti-sigma factor
LARLGKAVPVLPGEGCGETMKLEKHRYGDVIILKFTGEFDTFNLPAFSERIDRMITGGDTQMVFDLRLLKFINSAALGYLIKTSKRLRAEGGEMVLARPSKFVKKTLSTLGLDDVFKMFESVEAGVKHFITGEDIGEIKLEAGDYDEALTGSVPILFKPLGADGEEGEQPNQVGRIVTLYEDGLLFRYEPEQDGASDPVEKFLTVGQSLKLKFRQPFAVKEYYFEMSGLIQDVSKMAAGDDDDTSVEAIRVRYEDIKAEDREHLEQFVRDQESWKSELNS